MSDEFFTEDNQNETETPETIEEKIKLGEKEYTQEELSKLVGVASKVEELERQYNTKLDKVWPEYGRSQNELKSVKEQMERLQNQAAGNADMDPETAKQALEQAKKLGLLTKDSFSEILKENFRELYKAERETDRLVDELDGYEKEINGTDGRPRFDKIAVLEHMRENGFKNPMKAYKDMYEAELDQWKTQQLSQAKNPGMFTTTPSNAGSKVPADVRPTKDNLAEMVSEALQGR